MQLCERPIHLYHPRRQIKSCPVWPWTGLDWCFCVSWTQIYKMELKLKWNPSSYAGSIALCPLSHVEFEFARLYRPTSVVLMENSKRLQPLWVNIAARARAHGSMVCTDAKHNKTSPEDFIDTKVNGLLSIIFPTMTYYRACAFIHTSSCPMMPLSQLLNPAPP